MMEIRFIFVYSFGGFSLYFFGRMVLSRIVRLCEYVMVEIDYYFVEILVEVKGLGD